MKDVAIVGAGPSGLIALKLLLEKNYTATIYESSSKIGGTFAHKTYDDGALVSSRLLTAFSDFRFSGKAANKDHPSIPEYLEYLEQYCDRFKLWDHIVFNADVLKIERNTSNNQYTLNIGNKYVNQNQEQIQVDAVCICSGLHNIPRKPHIQSFHKFTGQSLHSSIYKERSLFTDQKVLIVGAGETGLDLSYRAAVAHATSVVLSARSGFLSVPHEWYDGAPLDSFITNLFECAYQHRWLEYFKIKWRFTTPFIRLAFMIGSGSSSGWNQWAGTKTTVVARGHHIINKSVKAMAYINRPLKKKSFLGRWIYSKLDDVTDPTAPDIQTTYATPMKALGGKQIEMSDGSVQEFDMIVFCTGYKQKFPFIPASMERTNGRRRRRRRRSGSNEEGNSYEKEDKYGYKYGDQDQDEDQMGDEKEDQDQDDPLPEIHNIVSSSDPNVAYIGFVRPNVGAIPPMSEIQVMWWIQHMEKKLITTVIPSYHLMGTNKRTGSYAVDYGAYCSDLAREIGCMPSLMAWFWKSPKIAIGYALGQSYSTYFRLEGPYQCDECVEIAKNELFEPVRRRPMVTNVLFVMICVLFGILNGTCWLIETMFFILWNQF